MFQLIASCAQPAQPPSLAPQVSVQPTPPEPQEQLLQPAAAVSQPGTPQSSSTIARVPMEPIEPATLTEQRQQAASPPRDPRSARLPPNWRTAADDDGCVYYYHAITRYLPLSRRKCNVNLFQTSFHLLNISGECVRCCCRCK